MATQPRIIVVPPAGELARLLDAAADGPLVLERDGVRYRVDREDTSPFKDYSPEKALAGIQAAGGGWEDLDAEQLKSDISRAREEGTRPLDRP